MRLRSLLATAGIALPVLLISFVGHAQEAAPATAPLPVAVAAPVEALPVRTTIISLQPQASSGTLGSLLSFERVVHPHWSLSGRVGVEVGAPLSFRQYHRYGAYELGVSARYYPGRRGAPRGWYLEGGLLAAWSAGRFNNDRPNFQSEASEFRGATGAVEVGGGHQWLLGRHDRFALDLGLRMRAGLRQGSWERATTGEQVRKTGGYLLLPGTVRLGFAF